MVKLELILKKLPLLSLLLDFTLDSFFFIIRKLVSLNSNKGENIIVVSFNRLGDTVFTIPAVKQIINSYKENIFIFCYPESEIIYKKVFSNVKFVSISKERFFFDGRLVFRQARKELKRIYPTVIFDLTFSIQSVSLIFNSHAKEIVGSNSRRFKGIYTHYTPRRKSPHLIDMYLDAIKTKTHFQDLAETKKFSRSLSTSILGKTLLINPLAGWKAKEWNLNKYLKLIRMLSKDFECTLLLHSGMIEIDVIEQISEMEINFVESKSIEELIEHIKSCSIFIGNDSGPLYIASLLGKPTFSIYGPTNFEYSCPIGEHHHIIAQTIKCSPEKNEKWCFTQAGIFGCPTFECMHSISIDDVYFEILDFLRKMEIPKKNPNE